MNQVEAEQLRMEIAHIFESGANEIRIFEMVKSFTERRSSDTMTTEEREIKSAEWRKNNLSKNSFLADVGGSLPNEIDLEQLSRLLAYSDKYEISIQFWPKQIAVYIAKDGVDLQDYGGDFDFAIGRSIEYLDRVTGNYR